MTLAWRGMLSHTILFAAISGIAATPLLAQPPCEQIRTACKNAGFVQGGPIGDRLVLDCLNPIVFGQKPPRNLSRPLPQIAPDLAAACREKQSPSAPLPPVGNLVPGDGGRTIYDARLAVTWLADANLAAQQTFGVPNINKSGSMNYATALRWVAAMNASNNGAGYLGHNNWQLPTAPDMDRTCSLTGRHGEPFGFHCSRSALGSLYYASLGLREPDSAVPPSQNRVGPFQNFQPYLYWSKSPAADPRQGFVTFSFSAGFQGANVFRNFLYVLPMIKGKLPGTPPASGSHLQVNRDGATVYDPIAQVTWLADANLPARQTFGIAGINRDGAMDHDTAVLWVEAMNRVNRGRGYLDHWTGIYLRPGRLIHPAACRARPALAAVRAPWDRSIDSSVFILATLLSGRRRRASVPFTMCSLISTGRARAHPHHRLACPTGRPSASHGTSLSATASRAQTSWATTCMSWSIIPGPAINESALRTEIARPLESVQPRIERHDGHPPERSL